MYDVIIIGLGAMGSAAAFELAGAGAKVLGLEQFGSFHDKGSSFGRTRMIRKVYMEGDVYMPLLERAYEKWLALDKKQRRPFINLCGGIYIGSKTDQTITATQTIAKTHNLALEELGPADIMQRFPAFRPATGMIGLFDPEAGYTNPATLFSYYHRMAMEAGAKLHYNEKVDNIRIENNRVFISTGRQEYQGRKLIVTAGAWLQKVARELGVDLPLQVRRMILNWFEPEGPPSHFKPGPFVPNLWFLENGDIVYGFPWTEEEEGVKYAFHNRFKLVEDPDQVNRRIGKGEARAIWEMLSEYVPQAAKTLLHSKVCFYTMTPDERFLIGKLPGHENVLIAGGFSGHGFKFTPVIGEILKDLALEGKTRFDISGFDLARFG
ncbi:MAG: N-methyl-L-tryptophan oxidase [Sphingomonadales bacterium]